MNLSYLIRSAFNITTRFAPTPIIPDYAMPYQINTSRLFLTYPQCTLTKERTLELLMEKFDIFNYIIASETHANGDPHIHVYLELNEAYRSRDSKFADIDGFHGNYQGCRSTKNVQKYCTKAEDYISNLDVSNLGKSSRSSDMESIISGKRTIYELVKEKPQYLMGFTKLLNDYNTFIRYAPETRTALPVFLPNPWGLVLPSIKKSKKRHYWIWSEQPNVGKTYLFAKPLINDYIGYLRVGNEPYYNIKGNESFIIFDEYNAAVVPYYILNSICDGSYSYRIFQGGTLSLKDPLIVVLSNNPIHKLYPNRNDLLYARFKEFEIK